MLEDRITYALMAAADRTRGARERSGRCAARSTSRSRGVPRIHWLSRDTAGGRRG
jgi:hypothetical protein